MCGLRPWKRRPPSWASPRTSEQATLRESVLLFCALGEGCIVESTSFTSALSLMCSCRLSGQGDQNTVTRTCGSGPHSPACPMETDWSLLPPDESRRAFRSSVSLPDSTVVTAHTACGQALRSALCLCYSIYSGQQTFEANPSSTPFYN